MRAGRQAERGGFVVAFGRLLKASRRGFGRERKLRRRVSRRRKRKRRRRNRKRPSVYHFEW